MRRALKPVLQIAMPDSPTLIHGLPADPGSMLDLLAQGFAQPEQRLQRQAIADALAGSARDDFVCVRALCGSTLAGAALAQQLPGRTAAVYGPQVIDSAAAALAMQLLMAVEEAIRRAGTRLAQSLLGIDQFREQRRLVDSGYVNAATLLYMVCDMAAFPAAPPEISLVLEPVTAELEARLNCVIESSYQDTLDCPLLNGLRTTDDVLEGYRAVGVYRPELWLLAQRGDEDVGCLLLADHPQLDNLELVYVGLTPALRGQGLGLVLTRQAQWLARQLGRRRMVLAVDAANAPAIALYEQAGFLGFDQRLVLIKRL